MRDTASMVGEDLGDTSRSNANEERIFVSIRVRPLNEKERARHDVSEWECISSNTIKFKNSLAERPSSMDAYTFDRVFGDGCSTQQVYEEGIKEVAISVVSGINSSIFAYGQTSSGKTYTMTGITEYAVRDIYDYIEMHKEREFVLKFSAMEIYNEAVRDLLSADSGPLRLLDDPEKGTVIEKLTEETLTEWSDLQKLLSICAAERTTEETSMNESSSRSHQILRLTVESSPSDYVGTESSGTLVASVNFVDLAGSERASQALTAGARLREGSHINRSLLTLGTVIRKLSKERNGHIPYRESKLTRILHNSLGGNARTAIICTISPARSHVEQSRNTLFFAGCAKQVTTNAQVNVVMSDKVLVKQLQKELARMENELRNFAPSTILLKERELLIKQMDEEIKELTRQRDIFQSHVENLLQSGGKDKLLRVDKDSTSELSGVANNLRPDKDLRSGSPSEIPDRPISSVSFSNECHLQKHENPEDKFHLDGNIPKFVGPDPHQGSDETAGRADAESENNCKEVRCIEVGVKTDHQTDVNALKLKDLRSGSPSENPDRPISSVSFYNEHHLLQHENPEDKFHLDGNTPKFDGADPHQVWDETTDRADAESENNCKEVRCIEVEGVKTDHQTDVNASFPASEEREGKSAIRLVKKGDVGSSLRKGENELSHVAINNSPDALQQKIQELQGTIDRLVGLSESSESHLARTRSVRFTRSRSCRPILAATFPPEFNKVDQETIPRAQVDKLERKIKLPLQFDKLEQKTVSPSPLNNLDQKPEPPPQLDKPKALPCQLDKLEQEAKGSPARVVEKDNSTSLVRLQDKPSESKFHAKKRKSSRNHSRTHEMDASGDMESIMDSDTEDTASVLNFVVRMNARAKATPLKEDFDDLMVLAKTSGTNDRKDNAKGVNFHGLPSALLPSKFERQQREIIELWHARNVPLVHRSSFFLLSKGELPDSVYLNEELRRLSFLKDTFSSGTKFVGEDGQNFTPDSSMKALNRERKMLSKQVHKKFSTKEREELYLKWCIDLKTKHRSIQLAWRLWTNTKDMDHVRESAALVAKLVGLGQSDEAPKKTFGLGFFARRKSRKYQIWKDTMSTLT